MTSKERMRAAMRKGVPDRVPAMCQLAAGHYFLHSGLKPSEIWFTSAGFAEALIRLRDRYRFDGILINLPGRDPEWRRDVERIEEGAQGETVLWKSGDRTLVPRDESPRHESPRPRASFASFEIADLARLDEFVPYTWNTYHVPFLRGKAPGILAEVPEYMFSTVDEVVRRVGDRCSVHAEVFSPFTHFMELFGYEEAMMALLDDPAKCREILDRLTASPESLARAYARRGVDAILISSAFAGGGFISKGQYEEFVLPFERRLIRAVKESDPAMPVYTHTCGAIGDRLELMEATGLDGIDTLDPPPLGTVDLAEAKRRLGGRVFIKGNVDSVNTMLRKDAAGCVEDLRRCLAIGKPGGAYIFSTACSVSPRVDPAKAALFTLVAEREGWYGEGRA